MALVGTLGVKWLAQNQRLFAVVKITERTGRRGLDSAEMSLPSACLLISAPPFSTPWCIFAYGWYVDYAGYTGPGRRDRRKQGSIRATFIEVELRVQKKKNKV